MVKNSLKALGVSALMLAGGVAEGKDIPDKSKDLLDGQPKIENFVQDTSKKIGFIDNLEGGESEKEESIRIFLENLGISNIGYIKIFDSGEKPSFIVSSRNQEVLNGVSFNGKEINDAITVRFEDGKIVSVLSSKNIYTNKNGSKYVSREPNF